MIVSWNWLKEYVRLDMSVDTLVERLMMAGFNHEGTAEIEGDLAIDLEITSNRPDCLGHLGIAREVAAVFGKELRLPATSFPENTTDISSLASVSVAPAAAAWCPQYRARVVEGVTIAPSPDWMQRRLKSAGQVPVNNVVDITNYVLLEYGQPLHAFDYEQLRGRRIEVRDARPKERFRAINNRDYELEPGLGVIADGERAVAIAGVMGGAETEIGPHTRAILLESAEFAPLAIRRSARALDLHSASSYRFERKLDPRGVAEASDRACHLITQIAGGTVARGFLQVGAAEAATPVVPLRWARVARILGIEVSPEAIRRYLHSLGLTVVQEDATASAWRVPSFRRDLTREIDLIEEIGRLHGYETVPENRVIPLAVAPRRHPDRVVQAICDTLRNCGYLEAINYSFTDEAVVKSIRPWSNAEPVALTHRDFKATNRQRQSLLPSLLDALRYNLSHGNEQVDLFEIAHVFLPSSSGPKLREPSLLGVLSRQDFRVARGHLEAVFARLSITPQLVPCSIAGLAAGKAAEWRLGDLRVGVIGMVDDRVLRDKRFDIRGSVAVAEILLDSLMEQAQLVPRSRPVPSQPAMARDLAIVLDEAARWADLERIVRQHGGDLLESLTFVDLYRGKQVPAGKKSLAFSMTFRAADRTLTSDEVESLQQAILMAIDKELGGKLRQ